MTSLHSLPIESLEWITSTISVRKLLKLYACGNRTLNTKLANGGVRRIEIVWKFSRWMEWPAYLFQLFRGIDSFTMERDGTNTICPTMALENLPTAIKSLRLTSDDCFVHVQRLGARFPVLFPHLEDLEMYGTRLSLDLFHNLPKTLTELSLLDFTFDLDSSDVFPLLPPTLRTLNLWLSVTDHNPELPLPPNLQELLISTVNCNFDFFAKLPATLTSLSIAAIYEDPIGQKKDVDWSKLPRGLKKLELHYPMALTTSLLEKLPPTLTKLDTTMAGGVKNEDMAKLPRSVTYFQSLRGKISNEGLVACPPTLSHLDVDVAASSPDIFSLYPTNCDNIRIVKGPYMKELRGPICPRLRSLRLAWITDEYCAMMPRESMYYLDVRGGELSAKGAAQIPNTISVLRMALEALSGDDVFEHLGWPKHVTLTTQNDHSRLNTETSHRNLRITHECLKRVKFHDKNKRSWKTLSVCFLNEDAVKLATDEFLSSLNGLPNMKSFSLELDTKLFEPERFAMLPRTLTDLEISTLSRVPTASDFDLLPPKLLNLDMRWEKELHCKWEDETFAHLPRTLNTLVTSNKSRLLTREGLKIHAPPYLVEYRAGWDEVHTFQPPMEQFYGPDHKFPVPLEDEFSDEEFDESDGQETVKPTKHGK